MLWTERYIDKNASTDESAPAEDSGSELTVGESIDTSTVADKPAQTVDSSAPANAPEASATEEEDDLPF